MSSLKTILVCALALYGGWFGGNAAQATPGKLADPVSTIAGCAGRLSALMEHKWLMGEDADHIQRRREAMVEILDAMMSPDTGRTVLARRIEAKQAQARLLQRSVFNDDKDDAERARVRAEIAIASCEALLLS